jgi:hypothetical protein
MTAPDGAAINIKAYFSSASNIIIDLAGAIEIRRGLRLGCRHFLGDGCSLLRILGC